VLVRHQLRILNRSRKRAPNLRATERIIAGLCALFMNPARVLRSAIVRKPSTLLHPHQVMAKRKYRMLFSPKHRLRVSDQHCPLPATGLGIRHAFDARYNNVGNPMPSRTIEQSHRPRVSDRTMHCHFSSGQSSGLLCFKKTMGAVTTGKWNNREEQLVPRFKAKPFAWGRPLSE
jgi:hypothetical protein